MCASSLSGPLTNLAEALERQPSIAQSIQEIVIMGGGAIQVPGNLGDGGLFQTNNKTAEWNIFVDPFAARIVFHSHIPIVLVPLDATNKVPIDLAFLREFQACSAHRSAGWPLRCSNTDREMIQEENSSCLGSTSGGGLAPARNHPIPSSSHRHRCKTPPEDGKNRSNSRQSECRCCNGRGRR